MPVDTTPSVEGHFLFSPTDDDVSSTDMEVSFVDRSAVAFLSNTLGSPQCFNPAVGGGPSIRSRRQREKALKDDSMTWCELSPFTRDRFMQTPAAQATAAKNDATEVYSRVPTAVALNLPRPEGKRS